MIDDMVRLAIVSTPLAARVTASVAGVAERRGDACVERGARLVGRQRHLAAEEVAGLEPAEREVRVGDGGLDAAAVVAGRARHRAGALRPDVEALELVEPGDRAAADADLEDVDHVAADREAGVRPADVVDRLDRVAAALDHGAFRRGAAHVERDQVVDAERAAERGGADAAADRARLDQRDRLAAAALGRDHAAVRAHQQERAGEPAGAQLAVEIRDVAAHLRPHIGVGGDRRGALVLVPLAGELGAGGDEHVGQELAQCLGRRLLVRRVDVGVDEADRQRLDLLVAQRVGERRRAPRSRAACARCPTPPCARSPRTAARAGSAAARGGSAG